MKFCDHFECSPVDTLSSGQFYLVRLHTHCYRVQEVERFRKEEFRDLLVYLDPQEQVHYFNEIESQLSAQSSIEELMSLSNLKSIEFFEFDHMLPKKLEEHAHPMLHKLLNAFKAQQLKEQGTSYELEVLKEKYLPSYIKSLELS